MLDGVGLSYGSPCRPGKAELTKETAPQMTCHKRQGTLEELPHAPSGRQQYCTEKCRKSTWWRAKNNRQVAGPPEDLDSITDGEARC